jgi:hypothetical protein
MKPTKRSPEPERQWRRTGVAARELGVHEATLKRYADRDHILIEFEHWIYGAHSNSPRLWDVPKCLDALAYRGRTNRHPVKAKKAT